MKSDKSIRNICVAAIKRKTIKPYSDFLFTSFFEANDSSGLNEIIFGSVLINEDELPIVQVLVNGDNWSLVTTRQIASCIDGMMNVIEVDKNVHLVDYGDFKDYHKKSFTKGMLKLPDDTDFEVLIEGGKASMVMIYGIDTLLGQLHGDVA